MGTGQSTRNSDIDQVSFDSLARAPSVAWPTVVLFLACLMGIASVSVSAVLGVIPLWLGTMLNGLVVYFLFSAIHDASHSAVSQVRWLNEAVGHIGLFFFGPLASFNLARWIHMQHHRFTNDPEKDPDHFGHKVDIFLPLRWSNFDYYYTKFFLKQAGSVRQKYGVRIALQGLLILALLALSTYSGYLLEVVALWLLPTRISSFLFVLMFVYLPHAPFSHTADEDEYQASNIRAGWEWLLTPLMAYQNYHLVHHLYPRAPFYRMLTLWNAKLSHHEAHNPYVVKTFGLTPREP